MRKLVLAAIAAIALLCPAASFAQVTLVPSRYSNTTLSTATGTCGTPSAGAAMIYTLGDSTASIDLGAGLTGTTSFNASYDGSNFFSVQAFPQGGGAPVSSTTASGRWLLPIAAYRMLCVNVTAFTSGSAALALTSSPAVFSPVQDVGSAANLSSQSSNNSMLVVGPGQWTVNQTPAVNTQASASKTAGVAGVRHVAVSCSGSVTTVAAQAAALTLTLRDGATGAGTVIWSKTIGGCPITTPCSLDSPQLNYPGTAATAMTCEWSGIPSVGNFEVATLAGYDAN